MNNEELRILKNTIEQMACDADDKGLTDFGLRLSVADAFTLCKLEPPRRWIPCSERLPEDFQDVLIWDNRDKTSFTGHYAECDGWTVDGYDVDRFPFDITHWMPMPEPQEEEQNETD